MLKQTPGNPPTVLSPAAAGASARTPTTMWQLLVWAYKRELVRVADGRVGAGVAGGDWPRGYGGGSVTGAVCRMMETGLLGNGHSGARRVMGGGAPGFKVHADAEWVHGLVKTLDRDELWLVVKTAEAGEPPEWNPEVEMAWVEPVLKANGRPAMIVDPKSKRPIACRIKLHGVTREEAARIQLEARDRYRKWYRLLWAMRDVLVQEDALTRWSVTGIGAERWPWEIVASETC